jgi:hypothetical protein
MSIGLLGGRQKRKHFTTEFAEEPQRAQRRRKKKVRIVQAMCWVGLWYFGRGILGEEYG